MNSAILVGRVGQDPEEIKYFESGSRKTSFPLAVDKWNPKTKQREASWFTVQFWNEKAESAYQWIKKGSLISVEGRIAVDKWKSQDGEDMEKYYIIAKDFSFEGSKKDSAQQAQ